VVPRTGLDVLSNRKVTSSSGNQTLNHPSGRRVAISIADAVREFATFNFTCPEPMLPTAEVRAGVIRYGRYTGSAVEVLSLAEIMDARIPSSGC
jgi:hypothetical protein